MAVNIGGLIAIIIFYLVILAIGVWASRKTKRLAASGSEKVGDDVMLAGRNIGLLVGSFTMTATWVGGGYINGTAEVIYSRGLIWAQPPIGYSMSLILGGLLFAKQMREKRYITMLDPLQEKYGTTMGAILYLPALCGEVFWSASILSALGATLSVILDINMTASIIASTCIAVAYTMFGGLYSVAYTDIAQLICIFVGLWLVVPFAMTSEFTKSISSTTDEWFGTMKPYQGYKYFDYFMLLMFGGIPWQVYFQRVLSSKSPRFAQILSFTAAAGCFASAIPSILIGAVATSADWRNVTGAGDKLSADGRIADTRMVLPMVLQFLTPPWVAFFGLGAVSAAVMSSADSSVLAASSMFSHNIYRVIFRPKASSKELNWVIRITIIIVGVLATCIALSVKTIYGLFVLCSDLVFVLLFPQLLLAIHLPCANLYGSIIAYFIGLLLRIGGGEKYISLPGFIEYPNFHIDQSNQNFPYRTIAMVTSLTFHIIVSYTTDHLFRTRKLPLKYDFLHCFEDDGPQQKASMLREDEKTEEDTNI